MAIKFKKFPEPLVIFGANGAAVIEEGGLIRHPVTGEVLVSFSITDRTTGASRVAAIPASRTMRLSELESSEDLWSEAFGEPEPEEPQEES